MNLFLISLKIVGVTLGVVLLLILIIGFLFIRLSPEFGGSATIAQKKTYSGSGHFGGDKFSNEIPTSMDMDFFTGMSILRDYIRGVPNTSPKNPLPVQKIDSLDIAQRADTLTRLTWFGHSAFLLEIEGKNILLDPMFGRTPSPHQWLGTKRFTEGLPIEIAQLPEIDAIIFSHDHYDHLDYGSVVKLKDRVRKFYAPLGVGVHLEAWGVAKEKIHELNWWEEIEHEGLVFACTPARHFSGRGLTDRFATFWSSWVIMSSAHKIFFSGDSGYGPHFKEVGERYGPFDFAMLECGQYDTRWADIHMMPEETAQAAVDLNARLMMPIHWGAFVLALHSWTDPIERVTRKAGELKIPIATPKIGEPVVLNSPEFPSEKWWEGL